MNLIYHIKEPNPEEYAIGGILGCSIAEKVVILGSKSVPFILMYAPLFPI